MPNHVDIATLEPKLWPRLHLLGLPRELRDQIYRYAIVSHRPVSIGPGDRRSKSCYNIPPLTKVSRQLRNETRRMFLEQNTLKIDEQTIITSLSSQPFNTFKALCTGSELKNTRIYSHRLGGRSGNAIDATLVATKTSDGLKVSFKNVESHWKVCSCRIERLAIEYGDQEGAIVRFLEALRLDYVGHIHYACNESVFDDEHDEEFFDLIIGHDTTVCDIHLDSVLYWRIRSARRWIMGRVQLPANGSSDVEGVYRVRGSSSSEWGDSLCQRGLKIIELSDLTRLLQERWIRRRLRWKHSAMKCQSLC